MKTITRREPLYTKQEIVPYIFDPMHLISWRKDEEIMLLESADIVTHAGEKSLLFLDLALRFTCRNNQVLVELLLDEARDLFVLIKEHFLAKVALESDNAFTLSISPLFHEANLLKKMTAPSALDVLRSVFKLLLVQENEKESVNLTGTFSYDFLDHFELLPTAKTDRFAIPDFLFYLPLTIIFLEHHKKQTRIICHGFNNEKAYEQRLNKALDSVLKASLIKGSYPLMKTLSAKDIKCQPDIVDEDFFEVIKQCKEHIKAGDVYQIVPSRIFSMPINDAMKSYRALRVLNPSPYMFYFKTQDFVLFGASPETFIKVSDRGKTVSIRPIAGTRQRGLVDGQTIDHELDSRLQASLCLDEKELAEHMMLVDLARNDIASVAKERTRRVKRLLGVDRYSHVMHLVSDVIGELRDELDALSAYQASMNMGTLMGAPKVKAAELLRTLEQSKRGFYGGAIGYLNGVGDMDTAIIIRSALVKDGVAHIRAGCGVVFDSVPLDEAQETKNKAMAVLYAIAHGDGE